MSRRDLCLAALMTLIWGSNFLLVDWGMAGMPPLLFAALRFAAVIVPAIFFVPKPAVSWAVLAAVGAGVSLGQFGFLYTAIHLGMPTGLAALVLQVQVPLTIVIAALVLGERVSRGAALGITIAVGGLALVGVGRADAALLPFLLCVLAGLTWAMGNVVVKAGGVAGGLGLVVWSAVVVPVPLLALSLTLDGPSTVAAALGGIGWRAVIATAWTAGISTLVGYGIFYSLMHRNSSASVVSWVLAVPPLAILLGWWVLGERPGGLELLGAAIALAGLGIAQLLPARAAARARRRDPAGRVATV